MADATTTGTTTPATAAASSDGVSAKWFDSFADADLKGYATNKGWESPEIAVNSFRNLEKLAGAPPEQILRIPKSDAPAEEWSKVWEKVGRPADPKEYGFKAPEGGDAKFPEWASKTFHEIGVPKQMATKLAEKFTEFQSALQAERDTVYAAEIEKQNGALKTEWGAAYEQNIGKAKLAAQSLGVDGETIDKLEKAMGLAGVMKFFHTLGSKIGESDFVAGGGGNKGFGGVMTPGQAQARIKELQTDIEFGKKLTSGDVATKTEWEKLHKWAYPEAAA